MSMNSDIFDLSLDNINEGTDECNCDCAATCPGGHIDKDATAAKETSIPVPSKTALSADTYNAALKALQKSFKEASDVIDIISNATIITEARATDKFDMKLYSKGFTILAKIYDDFINGKEPSQTDMASFDKIMNQTNTSMKDILDRNNPDECKRFAEKLMGMYKQHPAINEIKSKAPKSKSKTVDYMVNKLCKDLVAGNTISIKKYLFNDTAAVQEACDTIDAMLNEDDLNEINE